jgi:membrane protease YdiL (CAAX protease family)
LVFEAGLGLAALLVGYFVGFSPLVAPALSPSHALAHGFAIGLGLVAALPLVALVPILDRAPWPSLSDLREVVHEQLVPLVRELSVAQMALVALVAGWGEELLFRGLLQAGLAQWLGGAAGWWAGLVVATVLFALCHAITPSYAVLAGLMGLYLSALFVLTDNLLAPITTHAVYDFAALLYLTYEPDPRDTETTSSAEETSDPQMPEVQ